MGYFAAVGRLLFASVFILSAWQEFNEFGSDGGPGSKLLRSKLDVLSGHLLTHTGVQLPNQIEVKQLVMAAIVIKGVGGLLFVFGSSLGAVLLLLHQAIVTPVLCDFYNYDADDSVFDQLFLKFTQNLALFGALLFFISMKISMLKKQPKKRSHKTKTT